MSTIPPVSNAAAGDNGDEVARGLAEIEGHLAAAAADRAAVATAEHPEDDEPEHDGHELVDGVWVDPETPRVRELRSRVAEGRRVQALEAELRDQDTDKVRARRNEAAEAAQLHKLNQDPATRALSARRMVGLVTTAALVALVLAQGWSTANVHTFAAAGKEPWSAGWVTGWFIEPFISIALLTVVVARAYLYVRGHILAPESVRLLDRVEWLLLALTLGMAVYPTLPAPIGPAQTFKVPDLVLHALSPIVAVVVVRTLPVLQAEFARLDIGTTPVPTALTQAVPPTARPVTPTGTPTAPTGDPTAPTGSPTAPVNRGNGGAAVTPTARVTDHVAALIAEAVALVRRKKLREDAGVETIRKALKCGTSQAQQVRDALRSGAVRRA